MFATFATTKLVSSQAHKEPKGALLGPNSPRKTCGKPVGQAMETQEEYEALSGRIGASGEGQNRPLNNRGQLAHYRQVFHSVSSFIHSATSSTSRLFTDTYDKPTSYCPPGTPPLKITNGLKLKRLVNNVAPLLNPTNP